MPNSQIKYFSRSIIHKPSLLNFYSSGARVTAAPTYDLAFFNLESNSSASSKSQILMSNWSSQQSSKNAVLI